MAKAKTEIPERVSRAKFTEQLIVMVTPEVKAHIVAVATAEGVSYGEIGRAYVDAGIALAGGIPDTGE